MSILDTIVAHKKIEVAERRLLNPAASLEQSPLFGRPVLSLKASLLAAGASGIIAEFKRRSPSQGDINTLAQVAEVTQGYQAAGASGLSVLTDAHFFGGSPDDLLAARAGVTLPILRKDFIIDEYQILEARAIGADVILLIAACLSAAELSRLTAFAKSLGLEVLIEVHERAEIDKLSPQADIVGVNNRNLGNFSLSLAASLELFPHLPTEMVRISESGIEDPDAILSLRHVGYRGFLIGTYFMRSPQPHESCRLFIESVERRAALYKGAIAG